MVPSGRNNKALADALAGVLASLISLWIFYPVDVWKTNVQAATSELPNTTTAIVKVKKRKWRWQLWWQQRCFAGIQCKTYHTASSSFCYFYLYSWIFAVYHRNRQKQQQENSSRSTYSDHSTISTSTRLLLSAIAAMMNTCLTLPLDVIATRHQIRQSPPRNIHSSDLLQQQQQRTKNWLFVQEKETFYDASNSSSNDDDAYEESEKKQQGTTEQHVSNTTRNHDDKPETQTFTHSSSQREFMAEWKSYWKGLGPALILSINPSIHFTCYDTVKARLLRTRNGQPSGGLLQQQHLTMTEAFLIGLFAKFISTVSTYPFIFAKVKLMTIQDPDPNKHRLWTCLLEEYRAHGIRGLFRGCHLQLLHTMLKSALLMMLRERIEHTTRRLLQVE
jgi:hypothetical protein